MHVGFASGANERQKYEFVKCISNPGLPVDHASACKPNNKHTRQQSRVAMANCMLTSVAWPNNGPCVYLQNRHQFRLNLSHSDHFNWRTINSKTTTCGWLSWEVYSLDETHLQGASLVPESWIQNLQTACSHFWRWCSQSQWHNWRNWSVGRMHKSCKQKRKPIWHESPFPKQTLKGFLFTVE